MTSDPVLTISLLERLTDRELQSNYLNHLDRTSEIANLLAQITDSPEERLRQRDLTLRIIDLAFEVDLGLGAGLTASIASEFQEVIVDRIDRLDVSLPLKISLWHKTNSKAALPYLQKIFALKYPYRDVKCRGSEGTHTLDLTIKAILDIDRDLGIERLIAALYDSRLYRDGAIKILNQLAPVEAITALADVPELMEDEYDCSSRELVHDAIASLGKIGTPAALTKIRDILHLDKCYWSNKLWIQGLGIVAEPAMVEHLIYLLHFTEDPEVCVEALEALAKVKLDLAFEILHRSLYWITDDGYPNLFEKNVEILFRLDRSRALEAIESAIHCKDSIIQQRAAKALSLSDIFIDDRNLSILLNAVDEPAAEVLVEIVLNIRKILELFSHRFEWLIEVRLDETSVDRAYAVTQPILVNFLSHRNLEIKQKAISAFLIGNLFNTDYQLNEESIDILRNVRSDDLILLPTFLCDANEIDINFLTHHSDRFLSPSHLSLLLQYLEHNRIELKAYALANLGIIGDNSILPVLTSFLTDSESIVRASAVKGIVRLGTEETLPLLLELATDRELVTTLIKELEGLSRVRPKLPIFHEFDRDPNFFKHLLDIAELNLIKFVEDDRLPPLDLMDCLASVAITEDSVVAVDRILTAEGCTYHYEHRVIVTLAKIGT